MFLIYCIALSIGNTETLSGVTMADTIVLEEQNLQLNGLGLREKYWVDVYVAGLYLPNKMSDGKMVMTANIPKRIQIEFIYYNVPQSKMIEVLEENIRNNPQLSDQTINSIRRCGTWMQDFTTGDVVTFDYSPKTETTTIKINKKVKGLVKGQEFQEAIFAMYVGKYPATQALKSGLLGLN